MSAERRIGGVASSLAIVAAAAVALTGPAPDRGAAAETETVLSKVYTIDKKYRSMMGPYGQQEILLGGEEPQLLWITGYEAVMVAPDGETPMPQEFMCHSNLDIDLQAHQKALGRAPGFGSRLFTLSQGQLSVRFPQGFGIPVLSDEPLSLTTQVLNLNLDGETVEVRHKVTVEFVREQDAPGTMKALFPAAGYGLALLEGEEGYYGVRQPDGERHGPGCLVGESASSHSYNDGMGRKFTGHWVVKPGREVNRTLVTQLLRVPYDTTLHYIAVHLHPFAESLELRDLTLDKSLFLSRAENFDDKIGLSRVDSFSSVEGIPIYKDHDYEIVSVYNNTTEEDQDSMAVMYVYLRDLGFEKRWARHGREELRARRESSS